MNDRLVKRRSFLKGLGAVVIAPALVGAEDKGFPSVQPDYVLRFPFDHGAHAEYRTEWWYYTGQLFAEGAEPFRDRPIYGFQLTFFRRSERPGDASPWSQSYLAHAAITDLRAKELRASKRAARGGLSVAGAAAGRLRVWNHEWLAREIAGRHVLEATIGDGAEGVELSLLGSPPPPVLHGDAGFSRKAECRGCASIYYSLVRLPLEGELVRADGEREQVSGLGWMDHEFMSNALTAEQEGWDWFSLMLADGRSLMLFELRKIGGGSDFVSGTLIGNGTSRRLERGDFSVTVLSRWKSPRTGALYPSRWKVEVPSAAIELDLEPRIPDQEIFLDDPSSPVYWEGAISTPDESAIGYVEMTGYQKPLDVDL